MDDALVRCRINVVIESVQLVALAVPSPHAGYATMSTMFTLKTFVSHRLNIYEISLVCLNFEQYKPFHTSQNGSAAWQPVACGCTYCTVTQQACSVTSLVKQTDILS